MGRRKQTKSTPEINALQVEINSLEDERRRIVDAGLCSVADKIASLRIEWRILSHVASIARMSGDFATMNSTIDRLDKVSNTIHRLQRDLSLDLMLELKERADQQSEARATLARYRKD